MKNIAVFYGGVSVEHDVSIITGVMTVNSLDKQKFNSIPVYVDKDGAWYTGELLLDIDEYKSLDVSKLTKITFLSGSDKLYIVKKKKVIPLCRISVAINCMHGERGEDGSLAGLLKMCNIPLASPSLLASSICMDKCATKIFLKGIGVKTLPYVICKTVGSPSEIALVESKLSYPLIVKPVSLGSSIGISKASNTKELEYALSYAMRYSTRAIVEPLLLDFTEINCAVYKNGAENILTSQCERPIGLNDILTFDDKYKVGEREFPAKIPKKLSSKIQQTAQSIYSKLNISGIIRIDFMISSEGQILVNEINTVPGSLSYYLFCTKLKEFTEILTQLIMIAEKEYAIESSVKTKFSSSILFSTGNKSAKRL